MSCTLNALGLQVWGINCNLYTPNILTILSSLTSGKHVLRDTRTAADWCSNRNLNGFLFFVKNVWCILHTNKQMSAKLNPYTKLHGQKVLQWNGSLTCLWKDRTVRCSAQNLWIKTSGLLSPYFSKNFSSFSIQQFTNNYWLLSQ